MSPIKVQLTYIRSSKNYHVYQAMPDAPVIPEKIYVRQDAVGLADPPEIMTMVLTTDASDSADALDAAYQRGVEAGRDAGYQHAVDTLS